MVANMDTVLVNAETTSGNWEAVDDPVKVDGRQTVADFMDVAAGVGKYNRHSRVKNYWDVADAIVQRARKD